MRASSFVFGMGDLLVHQIELAVKRVVGLYGIPGIYLVRFCKKPLIFRLLIPVSRVFIKIFRAIVVACIRKYIYLGARKLLLRFAAR